MEDALKITETNELTEEDRLFENAINAVLNLGKKDYPNYVGGLKIASGDEFKVSSPVDKSIIFGTFQEPEDGLTDRAVVVAQEAFKKWSKTDASVRTEIFDKVLETITSQRYRLAALVTLSVGMTRKDSLEEVDRLIDVIAKACDDIEDAKGTPYGVWAVLATHNSPLAATIGYAAAAIIAGNTVVMMPSSLAPLPAYELYNIMVESGLPDGVLNLILDKRGNATNALANNLDVIGVVAAGSGERMENLMFLQADDELKFVNEIKGMNPIFVYKPSNVKEAAKTVIESAFSFSGQRLDSCSKVIVIATEQKNFVDALLAEAKQMVINDPTERDTFAGPIISEEKMKDFDETVDLVKGNIIFGGKKAVGELMQNGCYVVPAIVMGLDEDHDLNNMDTALPILSIQIAEDVDQAIDLINCSEYGTCAGIITKDGTVAERFLSEVNADELFINDPSKIIGSASKAFICNFMQN